ncbi:uncharacterized protein LOC113294691 [Papaver somniferum]|uniref:uncharacterized protein LOC113294691 n=1 Tax=Papaver somniferum TaxID=3469 RepID=UPI000E6F97DA|nr:uncharacterized protein LOC113294691 [Papaver somniferum]
MAAIHFDSSVDPWFLNYQHGKEFIPWDTFIPDLCARFEDIAQDNYVGSFNKLYQTTTIEDYYDLWEHYKIFMVANNPYLPKSFYTLSFISGLKEEIRTVVQMFKPDNTATTFYLARMQQASMHHQPKNTKSFSKPFTPSPLSISHPPSTIKPFFSPSSTFSKTNTSSSSPIVTHHPTTPTKTSPNNSLPPVKRLTHAQMQVTKDKGFCYNCDEFYRQGHRCKIQQLFMLIADEDIEEHGSLSTEKISDVSPSHSDSIIEISLHALRGNIAHDTIRISGHLNKHPVIVFIDTGITYSFIDAALTSKLGLHVSSTGQILVTVANGDITISKGICQQLNWEMQGHQFFANLRALPLGGCDIVLGDDWLRQLGDATFNFSQLISALLESFSDVFAEPTGLPLSRSLDHKIPLKTGHSPFAALILLVKKKDGTWRFCVDYSKLNDIIVKDKFPIPLIEELLDELNGSMVFSKIYLRSVYSPSIEAYMGAFSSYISFIEEAFSVCQVIQMLICSATTRVLRHIITANGVATDPDKVATMVTWPQPQTSKQLIGFLGLIGYYRKFIKNYGNICKTLTDMLKMDSFAWTDASTDAFFVIKTAMTSAPNSKPIAFLSKPLCLKALDLPTYEKEFLAIVMDVQKWKHYLCSQQFIIHTDHPSLKYLMDQKLSTVLQQKWLVTLMGFDYVIKYKKGLENQVVDALSRFPTASGSSLTLSQPQWVQDIHSSYESDTTTQQLVTQLNVTPNKGNYSYTHGILRFKGRLYILAQERDLMLQLLKEELSKAQSRMKIFADKKRSDRNFEFYKKIGTVAYKLKLLVGSRIYPVFHVSQLKKKIGLQAVLSPQLPLVDHAGQFVIKHVAVLDTRTTVIGTSQIPQVLVQWCNSDPADSTWEDAAHIQAQFPDFIVEDKDL